MKDQSPAQLQGWMQAVIVHPQGVAAGAASAPARACLDLPFAALETVVAPSAALSGAERLAIYWRAYRARLLQCLRGMFPVLLHTLGEELFRQFCLQYLQHYPPRSYTLERLPDAFPQYLAETRPDLHLPPDQRESWPDFLIEVATLELAFLKVYDGPGLEDGPAPHPQALAALTDAELLRLCPAPAPCLRLFPFRYPVHTYFHAVRHGEEVAIPSPGQCHVALTRQNYRLRLYELGAEEAAALQQLDGRTPLREALAGTATATVRGWLEEWVVRGLVAPLPETP